MHIVGNLMPSEVLIYHKNSISFPSMSHIGLNDDFKWTQINLEHQNNSWNQCFLDRQIRILHSVFYTDQIWVLAIQIAQ